ncbi:hypothetical protein BRADI_4g42649v3, partial [Brachypodium distachyon]
VKEAGGAKVGAGEKGGVGALEGGGGDGAGLLGGELGLDAEDADVGEEHEDEEVLSFFLRERAEDEEDEDEGEDLDEEDMEDGGEAGTVDYHEAYRDGGFGGVPASAAAIADLIKKGRYHEMKERDEVAYREAARRCMICIEDFEAGDDLGVMPCSHRFHHVCLVEWLSRSRLCPCCRHALPSEAQH